jgi:hypothetical protein
MQQHADTPSIRQHTPAYASMRQHTAAYLDLMQQHADTPLHRLQRGPAQLNLLLQHLALLVCVCVCVSVCMCVCVCICKIILNIVYIIHIQKLI